ncbi:MAG: hypothetical protein IJO14_01530 [Clostridia bacterium]|nr:hypothetical protein [Clostridia bacterium]
MKNYRLVSPYENIIWEGNGAWHRYKGNLHTHSVASDGEMGLREAILAYYNRGFDFLAMTDHGVTGRPWDECPSKPLMYRAFRAMRKFKLEWFTTDEYKALTDGTYPLPDGKERGKGMLCVPGGNEMCNLTATKTHVNGFFMKGCEMFGGKENDYECAVKAVEANGGVSFMNHPGSWLNTNKDKNKIHDPFMIHYFGNILLKYPTCLGMEVFNEKNSSTPWDRYLFDHVLQYCLPHGKKVIAFSNGDMHIERDVDSSFCYFFMPDLTLDSVKTAMQEGTSLCVTRIIRADETFGPEQDMDKRDDNSPIPLFDRIETKDHTITVSATDFDRILFIADGKIIKEEKFDTIQANGTFTLDLDTIDGAENFLYVRMQASSENGICLTQAISLDDGSEPKPHTVSEEDIKALKELRRKSNRFIMIAGGILGEIPYRIRLMKARKQGNADR